MDPVPKLKIEADRKEPEEMPVVPQQEKHPFQVVDGKAKEQTSTTEKKEKPPFYADLNFWVRVLTVMLLALLVVYFFSLE